jgi:tRNA-dihydrouridine synthase
LRALNDAGIHAIFLHGRRRPAGYLVENFRAGLTRIISHLEDATTPVHLVVTAGGRVDVVNG